MKASRTWLIWAALAFCAATILAAMTWQTRNALASERDRLAAENRANLQERMRLALWRMDTLGATLIVEESNGGPADFIQSRLEWFPNGRVTLPDGKPAPGSLLRAVTQPGSSFMGCVEILNAGTNRWSVPLDAPPVSQELKTSQRDSDFARKTANTAEFEKRSRAVDKVFSQTKDGSDKKPLRAKAEAPATGASEIAGSPSYNSQTRPVWLGDELFLLRAVSGPIRSIAGSWLNIGVLKNRLLAEARDLLPNARLIPAKAPSDDGLVLASFPLRLDPGSLPAFQASFSAPITLSLVAGWGAAAIGILAASLLVFGIMRLSERRASFVSAVTHELRTPLTTFRLYSDMLESGAVKTEKRGEYLRVLSREADRLSHLVENVLAFSRIERGSARSAVTTSRVADLLGPMRERFEARLATAGMSLRMDLESPAARQKVRVDSAAIEHILFNLVDNAAKYASSGAAASLEVFIHRREGFLEIHIADHGPGIPLSEHRRIFRAFHKSARDAAESRPGVGLGLALSRRLARGLGGDLVCSPVEKGGALFILSLPISGAD